MTPTPQKFVDEARKILSNACEQFEKDFPGAALPDSLRPDIEKALQTSHDEGVREEREACAKVAETVPWELPEPSPVFTKKVGGRIAQAIHQRSSK